MADDNPFPTSPVMPEMFDGDKVIQFSCHKGIACFNACCKNIDISLTPYDILRLKRRLGITSTEFLELFTLPYEIEKDGIAGVKLRPVEGGSACQFMTDEGCSVYEDRPTACRYYPVALLSMIMRDVLEGMIKAHEIQGVLALENSFNRVGLDHVLLVRVASTAVVTTLLGGTREQVINAVSQAFIDGGALRTYRHAPNTGSRKSWAAGDATSRAVRLALFALRGEMGYPSALTAKTWGFQDVLFKGKTLALPRPFGSYVMENVLFKISYPAEFHAQTAVEAAMTLHPQVRDKLDRIAKVVIETQEPGVRIIDKTGPLANPADRDHCIQYMVAIPLLFGRLGAADYEDAVARDPRVDALRAKMQVRENPTFTEEYYAADKRHIGNAVQVFFDDGSASPRVQVDFPIGHRKRRAEGMPVLLAKFEASVDAHFSPAQARMIKAMCADRAKLASLPVADFVGALATV